MMFQQLFLMRTTLKLMESEGLLANVGDGRSRGSVVSSGVAAIGTIFTVTLKA